MSAQVAVILAPSQCGWLWFSYLRWGLDVTCSANPPASFIAENGHHQVYLLHVHAHKVAALPHSCFQPRCSVRRSVVWLCNPLDCSLPGSSVRGDSPSKNTAVGCPALLQGIFQTQGSKPRLLHCRQILIFFFFPPDKWQSWGESQEIAL